MSLIVLLLPYVCTVFAGGAGGIDSGQEASAASSDSAIKEDTAYLIGAVAASMPLSYGEEALKAQCVILRTCYYLDKKQSSLDLEELQEAWGAGFQENYLLLQNVVDSTRGQVIKYQGEMVAAPYHAVSAGETRNGREVMQGEQGYLCSVPCRMDVEAEGYLQIISLPPQELAGRLDADGIAADGETAEVLLGKMKVLERDSAGYVTVIQAGEEKITGEEFRSRVGLASACFTLEEFDGMVRIVSKGLGHGLGMSQYGAYQMAEEGHGYLDILQYFYKDIEVTQAKGE